MFQKSDLPGFNFEQLLLFIVILFIGSGCAALIYEAEKAGMRVKL